MKGWTDTITGRFDDAETKTGTAKVAVPVGYPAEILQEVMLFLLFIPRPVILLPGQSRKQGKDNKTHNGQRKPFL